MEKSHKQRILTNPDVIAFLDIWFPVIEKIGEVQSYYGGNNNRGVPLVAPDVTGALVEEYIKAQKKFGLKRVIESDEA